MAQGRNLEPLTTQRTWHIRKSVLIEATRAKFLLGRKAHRSLVARPLRFEALALADAQFSLTGTPPPYSNKECSKQSRRQCPACAVQCSLKIGHGARCDEFRRE